MESYRDSVALAITSLGLEPIRSEDFGARADSPQRVCLDGVRSADATVLLLGERYGDTQESGLSATHEEYREARERMPVLVFVQRDATYEAPQRSFINEVREWSGGHQTVRLDQLGSVALVQPILDEERNSFGSRFLITESVQTKIENGLGFGNWLLDSIDPVRRLSEVCVTAALLNLGYVGWKTQAEARERHDSYELGSGASRIIARLSPPVRKRAALSQSIAEWAEDLRIMLHRQHQTK
jgi:hypothetical protein